MKCILDGLFRKNLARTHCPGRGEKEVRGPESVSKSVNKSRGLRRPVLGVDMTLEAVLGSVRNLNTPDIRGAAWSGRGQSDVDTPHMYLEIFIIHIAQHPNNAGQRSCFEKNLH
jgi:hypothetical protein